MNISSIYAWNTGKISRNNSLLLPRNIRGLIVGKSNCGKTPLLLNLLLQPDWLDYNHLYVFGKSLHQQEYQILKKGFTDGLSKNQVSNIFQNQEMGSGRFECEREESSYLGRLFPRSSEQSRSVLHSWTS